jgi:hypothetical protein
MTPGEKNVLTHIGVALLLVQTAERVIHSCLTLPLSGEAGVTLEALEAQSEDARKKTLGYFLKELRKRVDLDDSFDATLGDFLDKRNILVHRVEDAPGWDLSNEEGRANALQFIDGLIRSAGHIIKVFVGLMRAWAEQVNINVDVSEYQAFFDEIDRRYKPMVNMIFFEKER